MDLARLIAARDKAARIVSRRGEIFLPIFERIDREVEQRLAKERALEKVRQIVTKNGTESSTKSCNHTA